jgi:hypothetical protein
MNIIYQSNRVWILKSDIMFGMMSAAPKKKRASAKKPTKKKSSGGASTSNPALQSVSSLVAKKMQTPKALETNAGANTAIPKDENGKKKYTRVQKAAIALVVTMTVAMAFFLLQRKGILTKDKIKEQFDAAISKLKGYLPANLKSCLTNFFTSMKARFSQMLDSLKQTDIKRSFSQCYKDSKTYVADFLKSFFGSKDSTPVPLQLTNGTTRESIDASSSSSNSDSNTYHNSRTNFPRSKVARPKLRKNRLGKK